MFLDTPNSLKTEDIAMGTTNSCWIYSELLMSRYISRKTRIEKSFRLDEAFEQFEQFEHSELSVEYDIDIKHLINLTIHDIDKAATECENLGRRSDSGISVLSRLYFNKGLYGKQGC